MAISPSLVIMVTFRLLERKKSQRGIISIKRRRMFHQLESPSYSSKDAPRPPLSNALSFVLFEQLPDSLRSHLWTLSSKKKIRKILLFSWNFFFQNVITLVKRTRMVSQRMVPLYDSEDTLRPCVLWEGFSQVSGQGLSWLHTLCE